MEPYFHVRLPSGEQLLHRMATNPRRHPLHFGREVCASLLGRPQRADWKVCMPDPASAGGGTVADCEARICEAFKSRFAAYDPAGES